LRYADLPECTDEAKPAPPFAQTLQDNNGKAIKRFLTISESNSLPGPDLHEVQPASKHRRQTLKEAAAAMGQQQIKF